MLHSFSVTIIDSKMTKSTPTHLHFSVSHRATGQALSRYYPHSVSTQLPNFPPLQTHDFLNTSVSPLQAILTPHSVHQTKPSRLISPPVMILLNTGSITTEFGRVLLPSLAKKSGPFPTVRRTWNLPTHSEVFFVFARIA